MTFGHFHFLLRLKPSLYINMKGRNAGPRNMSGDNQTGPSAGSNKNGENNSSGKMAGVLLSLQSSQTQLKQKPQ